MSNSKDFLRFQEALLRDGLAYFVTRDGKVCSLHIQCIVVNDKLDPEDTLPYAYSWTRIRLALDGVSKLQMSLVPSPGEYEQTRRLVDTTGENAQLTYHHLREYQLTMRLDDQILVGDRVIAQERFIYTVTPTPEGRDPLVYDQWLVNAPTVTVTKKSFEPYLRMFTGLYDELAPKPVATPKAKPQAAKAPRPEREPQALRNTHPERVERAERKPRGERVVRETRVPKAIPVSNAMTEALERAGVTTKDSVAVAKSTVDGDPAPQA